MPFFLNTSKNEDAKTISYEFNTIIAIDKNTPAIFAMATLTVGVAYKINIIDTNKPTNIEDDMNNCIYFSNVNVLSEFSVLFILLLLSDSCCLPKFNTTINNVTEIILNITLIAIANKNKNENAVFDE